MRLRRGSGQGRKKFIRIGASLVVLLAFGATGCDDKDMALPSAQPTSEAPDSSTPDADSPDAGVAAPEETPNPDEDEDVAPLDPDTATAPDSKPSTATPNTNATKGTALAVLDTLAVKGRAPKTGYDRVGKFGTAWLDVDHNGCDTRNDILQRDLTHITREGSCKVLTGDLADKYTATTIHFVRGNKTSILVQIDHMVALSDAWQKGAQQLTQAQRISLANDPLNLMAADGPTNGAKGDGDAATWLPPNKSFRCEYVARQISVKATYGLWVTQAEKDAMQRVLSSCPKQPAYNSSFATPAKASTSTKTTAPKPAPKPSSVSYANCTAARDAGAAPLYEGKPGYEPRLDRDKDGVVCE